MVVLNIHSVENLIFYDNQVKRKLPEFGPLFAQWAFAKQNIGFRQLEKRTITDFLNSLQEEHLSILSQHFGDKVAIDKLDYHAIHNRTLPIEDAELQLGDLSGNFDLYRDKDQLYITFWR